MKAFVLFILLAAPYLLSAQEGPDGKAARYFDKALDAFNLGDYSESREWLEKATGEDSTYTDAWILLGDVCNELNDADCASNAYLRALDLNPGKPLVVRNLLANTLFESEHYREAAGQYRIMLEEPSLNSELRGKLSNRMDLAEFRQALMDHPVSYTPENLGTAVNSGDEEYVNHLGPESDLLVFTRKSPISNDPMQRDFEEDFFRSFLSDTGWTTAERFSFSPTTRGDAGGLCMSADGRLIFFTACFRRDGEGSCDIYYSVKKGEVWSEPKNMGPVINSDNWDAQPSLSPDGKTLYFASNREGSIGSSDIWKTERLGEEAWSKPENLGEPVNTRDAEMGPFIHFDNQTLYFSSKGHMGMAGQDLFVSRRTAAGWSAPKNLGYPINTSADELNIVVAPNGRSTFISAALKGGLGGYDIYSFLLPEESRPVPVTYLKGSVFDAESGRPLKAEFDLADLQRDSLIMHAFSSAFDGSFLVCVPTGRSYALHVSCPGYLFHSEHFELTSTRVQTDPFIKDIPLQPVRVGNIVVMRNIFFDTDQSKLKEESLPELDKMIAFLKENPGISLEISGHTDNTGTASYNLELSERRARVVWEYIISGGIERGRLSYAGYGFTLPVASNDTEEGKALNRRTEAKVTGIGN